MFMLVNTYTVFGQKLFANLDSLIEYATARSYQIKSNEVNLSKAKMLKYAALIGILDISGNTSFTFIDNKQLPVSLFPAEIFGGEAGTFKEIKTGVKYNATYNHSLEIKLFNMAGYENYNAANKNYDLSEIESKLTLKKYSESIAALYYNISNLQKQITANHRNLDVADTLLKITENKFKEGFVNEQDLNNSKCNYLNTKNILEKNTLILTQQYSALKTLCDMDKSDSVLIDSELGIIDTLEKPEIEFNNLLVRQSKLNLDLANSMIRKNLFNKIPTLSFVYSYSKQQYSNDGRIFSDDNKWNSSNYIGLKLSIPIQSPNTFAQIKEGDYNAKVSELNYEHSKKEADNNFNELTINYRKAIADFNCNSSIYKLNVDSYFKNLNLYKAGLISLETILNSYNSMVNSENFYITSGITVNYSKSLIVINNRTVK